MALCQIITCSRCGQSSDVWFSSSEGPPTVCHACTGKDAELKKREALAALAALPLEQRIARIEEWIYDYQPTYVPPPRF